MEKIPTEWVDRIFNCMTEFYGKRWEKNFTTTYSEDFLKTIWWNGLTGLTYDQIKGALILCKRAAQELYNNPPNVIEFYLYAKGTNRPYIDYQPKKIIKARPEIANENIEIMRKQVGRPPINLDREKRAFL